MMWKRGLLLLIGILVLAACDQQGGGDAAQAVENYLQARVDLNAENLTALTCAEREFEVPQFIASFQGREAVLEGVSCTVQSEDAVTCEGKIITTYQGEQTEFEIPNYRVVQEDGEWKVCGEAG